MFSKNKVKELAERISKDYAKSKPLMIGILKGAWVFMADLVRKLTIPVECDFLRASSYGSSDETSGTVKVMLSSSTTIEGRDILLVEDIVDTGLTLSKIVKTLAHYNPKTIKICSLLDKPARHQTNINIDYLGFTVPNKFIVGYGLDYDEKFRYLPYVGYIEIAEKSKK
ncbi:MAG TPA: hypoxanthine phosphoribosyltransferase [bacterium (Candidatus Stahlbacteria)]|nr:hypoxanthine phosphoribosyltransferase [Candidatus Stahlbacteria bacterium]